MPAPTPLPDAARRPPPPTRRLRDSQVLGGLLVVFGLGWIVRQAGAASVSWPAILSAVLISLGVGMVLTARAARRSRGLIAVGIAITLVLASTSSLEGLDVRGGKSYERPTSRAAIEPGYRLEFGELTIDLTAVDDFAPGRPVAFSARVVFGQLNVVLPDGVAVRIAGKVGAGDINVNGRSLGEGVGIERIYTSPDYGDEGVPGVDLTLDVLFGSAEVRGGR